MQRSHANIEKELSKRVGLKELWWDRLGTEKCAGSFKSVLED